MKVVMAMALVLVAVLAVPVSAWHHPACKPMVLISEKPLATGGVKAVFQNQNQYPITATYKIWFYYTKIVPKSGLVEEKFGSYTKTFTVPGHSKMPVIFVGPVFDRWTIKPVTYGAGNGCPTV